MIIFHFILAIVFLLLYFASWAIALYLVLIFEVLNWLCKPKSSNTK